MSDIYARQRTVHSGSFPSDQAALTLAGTPIPLGIVQSAQVQFAQAVSRIYDVGNGGLAFAGSGKVPVYYVGGRTQGQGQFSRVMGPQSGAICEFYSVMGNVCSPQDLTLTFQAGCGTNGAARLVSNSDAFGNQGVARVAYTLNSVVMTSMGIRVDSQSMIVNDDVSIIFANMACNEVRSN
jgi:hypothetical protein